MNDLQSLFEKDPLLHTKEDRAAIIARLREARNQFLLGDKTAGKVKPTKPKKSAEEVLKMDLSDLEI